MIIRNIKIINEKQKTKENLSPKFLKLKPFFEEINKKENNKNSNKEKSKKILKKVKLKI